MIKTILFVSILFVMSDVFGQGHRDGTASIRTQEAAQNYTSRYPTVAMKFLCKEFYRSPLGKEPDTLKAGDVVESMYFESRLVEKLEKEIYRFKLISVFDRQEPNAAALIDSMYARMNAGVSFSQVYSDFLPPPPKSELELGDLGWVDADLFTEPFSEAIKSAKKGDVFVIHDTVQGWHNLVWMTHDSKKASGFIALEYLKSEATTLPMDKINHAENIRALKGVEELRAYAIKYPEEVTLELIQESASPYQFNEFVKAKAKSTEAQGVYFDDYEKRYRWIKDTSVVLYSFDYIYLNGDQMSKKDKDAAIKDIYKKFNAGVDFSEIIKEYWPENNGMSTLSEIDGGMLDPDFTAKLKTTGVGELFVARVSQSYFIGVPNKKPRTEKAFLVLSY